MRKPDFRGWATRFGIRCSDGRVISKDAFKDQDGNKVSMVWNHRHDDPDYIIGHAILHCTDEGVIADCYLNDWGLGATTKRQVKAGNVEALSIHANGLVQKGSEVMHGIIREVSVVHAGANPGAFIFPETVTHNADGEEELVSAVFYNDAEGLIENELAHSAKDKEKDMADEKVKDEEKREPAEDEGEETIRDVFDTLNEKQKKVVYALVGAALADKEDGDDKDEEKKENMKHNVFENEATTATLSHSAEEDIIALAKTASVGSFQDALEIYADQNGIELQHTADPVPSSGFLQTNADGNVTWLFPEYKDVRPGAPELITSDQGWISTVLNKVHKSPISRIRTSYVDIRNIDSLRARGYKKGMKKEITGNFALVRRTTDPQTVYVKSQLHRDDIVDITDFDYVQYLYNIDRMNLNEELAMAIMLGDFRSDESDDKIRPEHIRPIWTDDELYTMHFDLDLDDARERLQGDETGGYFGENYILAEAMIEKCLYAREKYKGTGTPDMFITPHMVNVMLLARDRNGRRIFSSKNELASALNVGAIHTAEQFADRVRTDGDNNKHKLLSLIVNLADYSLGSTKGGEITHFTQFDIDFNQQKSLLETRCSGALTRVYSAIAIEEPYSE